MEPPPELDLRLTVMGFDLWGGLVVTPAPDFSMNRVEVRMGRDGVRGPEVARRRDAYFVGDDVIPALRERVEKLDRLIFVLAADDDGGK